MSEKNDEEFKMWIAVHILFLRFNSPLIFTSADSKAESICKLRDTMAIIPWEFWERIGIFNRAKMDINPERKVIRYSIEEYPSIEWEYESSCIYHLHTGYEESFAHLDMLIPCKINAFELRNR